MVARITQQMWAEDVFLTNLGLIDRITAFVCRRNHINTDEAEEFAAHVRLKLIDNDYAVLRKFEGRSSLATYLTTVIHRLFLQYRVDMWGKWRPSAQAKRLGETAITLERMLTRDGYSFAEAVEVLTTGADRPFRRAELEAIYLRLPPRGPRPVPVDERPAADNLAAAEAADDSVLSAERLQVAQAAAAAVDAAMAKMDAEDQIILRMRFWSARRMPEIASSLGLDQKKLYKRVEHLLSRLRMHLQSAGIAARDIQDLIAHGDQEIVFGDSSGGKSQNGRSHSSDGELQMKSAADETSDATL